MPENLITLTIRSTHYFLIDTHPGKLMVDTGWPGSLPELKSQLKRFALDLAQIRYLMVTHLHPDHAGLTQELKRATGARLILHEIQLPFLDQLKAFYASKGGFEPIQVEKSDLLVGSANRAALREIGVSGELVETPGHSDDSISLVLDSGLAFVGDLHPPDFVPDEARALTCNSWKKLLDMQVKTVYPAHSDPFPMEQLREALKDC